MTPNRLSAALVGLLLLAVLATAVLSVTYIQTVRKLQRLQYQITYNSWTLNQAQQLAGEAIDYSKRNPAIDPVLQSLGLKNKATNSPPAKTR